MGCVKSSNVDEDQPRANRLRTPRPWRYDGRTLPWSELREMRSFFWSNAPRTYGGRPEIWEALEAAAACDLHYAQAILDANSIRLGNPPDMTVCFDDRDNRYELPLYVLSEPTNMEGARRNILDRIRRRG